MATQRYLAFLVLLALAGPSLYSQSGKKPAHGAKSAADINKAKKIKRAFTASTELRPMAQQLLENRSALAYASVESYAAKHAKDDAGPLAWLVLGYAHSLDKDFAKAEDAWRKAQGVSALLGDCLDYLRATAYAAENKPQEVIKTLTKFEQKYPDSLYLREAGLLYAGALISSEMPAEAAAYLEKRRQPVRADAELLLGKAYAAADRKEKAVQLFRWLYFEMPLSPEAEAAAQELKSLGEAEPVGKFEERHTRAELLLKGKRYAQAAAELSPLIEQAPSASIVDLQSDYATALYRSHKRDDARRLFAQIAQNPDASTELKAAALYFLAELARDKDDREAQADFIAKLRTLAPQSSWLQEALFSAANMYMLKHDYEPAIRFYTEMYQSLPSGRWASYAHWRAAWFSYRLGKRDDARRLLDEQIERYPISGEISAALYWRGRVAEDEDNAPLARACYGKLTEKFHYFYYANLARTRLATLGPGDVAEATMLTKLRGPAPVPQNWDAPSGNLRLQKAQLLANAALSDFAIREMQAAASGSSTWQAGAMAQLYEDAGNYKNALETLKRTVPTYFSAELNQLPRPVWEELFPRPYWADLKKHSADNQLDPYLVASLIRQESEFDPAAVSTANALGLMQLLPSVGRGLAKELKIKQYSQDDLFVAPINIGLGTHYFRHMVDHYNGQVEYALAAYNAGEDRVDDWRRNGSFKDVDEFVESIPFMQTREYVQAIMRNAVLYRLLYPKG